MRGFFSVVLSILGGFSDVLVLDILLKPGNPGLRYELYCVCFGDTCGTYLQYET